MTTLDAAHMTRHSIRPNGYYTLVPRSQGVAPLELEAAERDGERLHRVQALSEVAHEGVCAGAAADERRRWAVEDVLLLQVAASTAPLVMTEQTKRTNKRPQRFCRRRRRRRRG
eukprot:2710431-Pyramimonas_sp.AAC.1